MESTFEFKGTSKISPELNENSDESDAFEETRFYTLCLHLYPISNSSVLNMIAVIVT